MSEMTKNVDIQKTEITGADGKERTHDRRVFIPRTDIYETENEIVVVADIPGCDEASIDITLEKNILKIEGYVNTMTPDGYKLYYSEYATGDYQRTFALSDEIDRDQIEARVKNGVLKLILPKAGPAKAHKITVKPE